MKTIDDCYLVKLPRISGSHGSLTPIEGARIIPFEIARVYYLFDIPVDASRGGHAHKVLQQLIVCVMGSFDLTLDDGSAKRVVTLRRVEEGLYVAPQVWRELGNFSSGAVCLTLASEFYDESDYIRRYEDFLDFRSR